MGANLLDAIELQSRAEDIAKREGTTVVKVLRRLQTAEGQDPDLVNEAIRRAELDGAPAAAPLPIQDAPSKAKGRPKGAPKKPPTPEQFIDNFRKANGRIFGSLAGLNRQQARAAAAYEEAAAKNPRSPAAKKARAELGRIVQQKNGLKENLDLALDVSVAGWEKLRAEWAESTEGSKSHVKPLTKFEEEVRGSYGGLLEDVDVSEDARAAAPPKSRKQKQGKSTRGPETQPYVKAPDLQRPTWLRRREMERLGFLYDSTLSAKENEENFHELKEKSQKAKASRRLDKWIGPSKGSVKSGGLTERLARRGGPLGAFVGFLAAFGARVRLLALVGLALGVFFIPVSFFTFSGWSIAAMAMVVVSAVYFIFLNLVKLIATAVVGLVNLLFSVLGGLVVKIGETVMTLFAQPQPCDYNEAVVSAWCPGQKLLQSSLISKEDINAIDIPLLNPRDLMPEVSTQTLAAWFGEVTGLYDLSGPTFLGDAMGRFAAEGNLYVVMGVFFGITAGLGLLIYFKVVKPALRQGGLA